MVVFDPNPADDRYTTARNGWMGTGYAKGAAYTKSNNPWDTAEQGRAALSQAQRNQNEQFASAASSSVSACADADQGMMVCRAEYIKDQLGR